VGRLFRSLGGFAEEKELGEVFISPLDVLFAEGDYLEPDILFVRRGRDEVLTDRGIEGPPDLVVEVLTPSTEARDRGIKLDRYRLYEVPEYWIVDPDERTIHVWKLAEGSDEPAVHGPAGTLSWTPIEGAATLEIDLTELLGTE
jgi:Uma2 family endonuclease